MPDLLIEIGTEEIPSSYIPTAVEAIGGAIVKGISAARLESGALTLLHTHRRMVIHLTGVSATGESITEDRRGPPASAAFDADGNPTKAALGFARGQGVDPSELTVVETKKGAYVTAMVTVAGESAADVLGKVLPKALRSTPFPKSMRWTGSDTTFARPIRYLTAILGEEELPLSAVGLTASRETRGHAFLSPEAIRLDSADLGKYCDLLRDHFVMVSPEERRQHILEGIAAVAGDDVAAAAHPGLLSEVVGMAEWPNILSGAIENEYLELPVEVLETAMRVHLRFFPVFQSDGGLEPRFLAVMDRRQEAADLVREGMERVLRSRLSDARFFNGEDKKTRLQDLVPELDDKSVHRDLGSYGDKVKRMETLAGDFLIGATGLDAPVTEVKRAALLCKADLLTEMVGEFPELQGTVGRIYAERDGEDPAVALAIEDHYRPRGPRDDLPRGPVSIVVALAEKLDNLVSFVSVAGLPSGSSDPFGLRRQALGIVRLACEKEVSLDLEAALSAAAETLPGLDDARRDELTGQVLGFVKERFYQWSVDAGLRYDLVRAAMGASAVPFDARSCRHRIEALMTMADEPFFDQLMVVVERTANITRDMGEGARLRPELLVEEEEQAVGRVLAGVREELDALLVAKDYVTLGRRFAEAFGDPVHEFFEKVFVNVDDQAIRANRLALLREVNDLFGGPVADLSKVEKRAEKGAS